MKKVKQETGGVMIYKHEEIKQMVSIKNGMSGVTMLS